MDELVMLNHWIWFALAAALIILEVLIGASFFLLWLGIIASCIGALVWLLPTMTWQTQIFFFALGSISSILLWRRYTNKHPTQTDRPSLNRRSEQYIGRIFTLDEPIVNGRGKIRVDDSIWSVEGPDLPAGTQVEVIGVDGVLLKVKEI